MSDFAVFLEKEHPHEFKLMSSINLEQVHSISASLEGEYIDPDFTPRVALAFYGEAIYAAIIVYIKPPLMRVVSPLELSSPQPEGDRLDDALRALQIIMSERMDQKSTELALIAVPRPVEQIGPGDEAHCGGGPATFGMPVRTKAGARGILTAGHAARTAGAGAYDARANLVGKVVDTRHCGLVNAGVSTVDVAVIELSNDALDSQGPAPVSSGAVVGTARLRETVTAYGAVTAGRSAPLLAAGTSFAGTNPAGGDFGHAMMTLGPISAPGDSGAPVFNQGGLLVGHVVAGYPGVYSIVQDATYQLEAVGVTLR